MQGEMIALLPSLMCVFIIEKEGLYFYVYTDKCAMIVFLHNFIVFVCMIDKKKVFNFTSAFTTVQ